MKYEEALNLTEEGGTIVTSDGKRHYNVTKARKREREEISREIKLQEKNKREGKNPKLAEHKLNALRKRKMEIAKGNEHEYTTDGNIIKKNEYKVDTFNVKRDPRNISNWANQKKEEKEISDRLNNQDSNKKFMPR